MSGFVYLVGAGPGDRELITMKGLKAIARADVIVYDHLAAVSLLGEAPSDARWIYAGKKAGHHHLRQSEIEETLVREAQAGHVVVRLKGGDPFIFGRGGEEALALKAAGIPYEIIPGVSSCYAAAETALIPVTHRGLASSLHVITGHEDPAKKTSSLDYHILAQEEGTLVFLMGLSRIRSISDQLMANGKRPDTPAAVVSNGTTARQRVLTGRLSVIADQVDEAQLPSPAIFVVGQVAALREKLLMPVEKPLDGMKILVTAADETGRRLASKVETLGGEAVLLSLIGVKKRAGFDPADLLRTHQDASGKDMEKWLLFTSRNGVNFFFEQLKDAHIDHRQLGNVHFAVIGKGTAEALEAHGFLADLIPEQACSQSLAQAVCSMTEERNASGITVEVIMCRAKESSPVPAVMFEEKGICYRDQVLYETCINPEKAMVLEQVMADLDIVTFCSSSAVLAFSRIWGKALPEHVKTAFIGPVSARTGAQLGIEADVVASVYDLDGMVSALTSLHLEWQNSNI